MSDRHRCCKKGWTCILKVCGMSASSEHSGHTHGAEKLCDAVATVAALPVISKLHRLPHRAKLQFRLLFFFSTFASQPTSSFSCWLQCLQFLWCVTQKRKIISTINLLKPTGHVMHQRFNIQQPYVLATMYLCVLYSSENKQRLVPLTA